MVSAVTVRPLRASDLEAVRWVIYRAYFEALVELYGAQSAAGYEVRSLDFMRLYLRRDAAGSFVAERPDGAAAGAVFCFVWGEVGWFGSLAVAPEWQGHGIGQALTERAVTYLAGRGCRRVGLETWPHSPRMRHLYGKFDFRPARSTIKLSRPVASESDPRLRQDLTADWTTGATGGPETAGAAGSAAAPAGSEGAAPPRSSASIAAVAAVTAAQRVLCPDEPRVDYVAEAAVPLAAGWADLVVVRDGAGEPLGFALCYLKQPGGGPVSALDVRLLGVAPDDAAESVLDCLLEACDARARRAGLASVTVDVNLRHTQAVSLLRARQFRPVYELLRMERPLPGFDPQRRSPAIDCARWAG